MTPNFWTVVCVEKKLLLLCSTEGRKKVTQVWKDMRVSTRWQKFILGWTIPLNVWLPVLQICLCLSFPVSGVHGMCSCFLLLQFVLSDRVVSQKGMSNVSARTDLHSSAWTQSFIKASISTSPSRHLHTHSITGFHTRSYSLPLFLSGMNSLNSCTFLCVCSISVQKPAYCLVNPHNPFIERHSSPKIF